MSNVPNIRFKGFTDAWEQRELGDVVKITMGQSPNSINYTNNPDDYILVQGNADMKNGFVHPRVWTTQITKTAEIGDIILSVRAPVGDVAKTDYDIVLGRGVAGIKGNQFIFQLLKKYKEDGYWKKISTGSTFESINSNIIKEAKLLLPSAKEQNYLGDFFNEMDQTITLLQRKINNLNKVKKGLLQKLFPTGQSINPRIRFNGFNQDWEQHELGKNSEIAAGGTPKTTELSYWNPEEIPWMSSGEINNRRINRTEKMISQLGYKRSSATWIPKKSVLIALAGQGKTRGMVAVNEIPLTTNQSIAAIIPKEKLYYEFIYQNLLSRYEELRLISSGDGSRGGLNKQIISSIFISSPSIKEQQIIGDFFKNIDDTITLLQKEVEVKKQIKKGFLQKLFPKE